MDNNTEQESGKKVSGDFFLGLFRGLGKVLNEVGIAGFTVISIAIIVFYFSDTSQKKEIINVWVLFKGSNIPFIVTVLVLTLLLISQQVHFKYSIKQREERIAQLTNKKSTYYVNKIGTKLSSSKKPGKS